MNNFVLSYDPLVATVTPGQLLQYVKDSRSISSWYSPFMGTYLLKSELSAWQLSEQFRGVFAGAAFMVAQVWPGATGGAFSNEVWQWLNGVVIPPLPKSEATG